MNIQNKINTISRGELGRELDDLARQDEVLTIASMIDYSLKFTNDKSISSYVKKVKFKILGAEKLTYKEANTIIDLIYLYRLNAFFPYEYNSIDKIRKEYGFCNKFLN